MAHYKSWKIVLTLLNGEYNFCPNSNGFTLALKNLKSSQVCKIFRKNNKLLGRKRTIKTCRFKLQGSVKWGVHIHSYACNLCTM